MEGKYNENLTICRFILEFMNFEVGNIAFLGGHKNYFSGIIIASMMYNNTPVPNPKTAIIKSRRINVGSASK